MTLLDRITEIEAGYGKEPYRKAVSNWAWSLAIKDMLSLCRVVRILAKRIGEHACEGDKRMTCLDCEDLEAAKKAMEGGE